MTPKMDREKNPANINEWMTSDAPDPIDAIARSTNVILQAVLAVEAWLI